MSSFVVCPRQNNVVYAFFPLHLICWVNHQEIGAVRHDNKLGWWDCPLTSRQSSGEMVQLEQYRVCTDLSLWAVRVEVATTDSTESNVWVRILYPQNHVYLYGSLKSISQRWESQPLYITHKKNDGCNKNKTEVDSPFRCDNHLVVKA